MSANSRFAVATHLLAGLAFAERGDAKGEPVSSETLAESVNTSAIVVRRLLGTLRDAGLVQGHLGRRGGASLARRPEEITLLDIYRAVDDPNVFAFSKNAPNEACPVGCRMNELLAPVFDGVQKAIEVELGRIHLSDLLVDL
ncbi:Rrf2 family transcriptional regulator, group III [Minicystis rosea]|nr:Rrf2 family transcriptional regulator, group III [Minicystis rosea]